MTTAEIDAVQNQLCSRIEELGVEKLALLEENAALAAHVERLKEHIENVSNLSPTAWGVRGLKLISESPSTSLAHLKAQWQAEALDEASCEFEVHERAKLVLQWRAQGIRRQAERDDHD